MIFSRNFSHTNFYLRTSLSFCLSCPRRIEDLGGENEFSCVIRSNLFKGSLLSRFLLTWSSPKVICSDLRPLGQLNRWGSLFVFFFFFRSIRILKLRKKKKGKDPQPSLGSTNQERRPNREEKWFTDYYKSTNFTTYNK